MVIFKSILAGIFGVLAVVVASIVLAPVILRFALGPTPHGEAVGWDVISIVKHSFLIQLILAAGFVVGFFFQYRRASGKP